MTIPSECVYRPYTYSYPLSTTHCGLTGTPLYYNRWSPIECLVGVRKAKTTSREQDGTSHTEFTAAKPSLPTLSHMEKPDQSKQGQTLLS